MVGAGARAVCKVRVAAAGAVHEADGGVDGGDDVAAFEGCEGAGLELGD